MFILPGNPNINKNEDRFPSSGSGTVTPLIKFRWLINKIFETSEQKDCFLFVYVYPYEKRRVCFSQRII